MKIGIFWTCWLLQKTVDSKINIVDGDHAPSQVPTIMTWTLPRDPTLLNNSLESSTLCQISSPALKPFANTHEVRQQKKFFLFPPCPWPNTTKCSILGAKYWQVGYPWKSCKMQFRCFDQAKVITKSHFWPISPKTRDGCRPAGTDSLVYDASFKQSCTSGQKGRKNIFWAYLILKVYLTFIYHLNLNSKYLTKILLPYLKAF